MEKLKQENKGYFAPKNNEQKGPMVATKAQVLSQNKKHNSAINSGDKKANQKQKAPSHNAKAAPQKKMQTVGHPKANKDPKGAAKPKQNQNAKAVAPKMAKASKPAINIKAKELSKTKQPNNNKNQNKSVAGSQAPKAQVAKQKNVKTSPTKASTTAPKAKPSLSPANAKAKASVSVAKPVQPKATKTTRAVRVVKEKEEENPNLKITFLGGIGEIGKNMTAFEYGKDMIVVDAGQSFPDGDMPGVDQVVQDITYLEQHKDKLRGLFITHGHEDHIGGVPYFLDHLKTTIYGSAVSMGLVENKLKEAKKTGITLKAVKAGTVVVAGNFKVEFVSVTHSIPGSFALVITTPAGVVVHTGDLKIDFTPVGNDVCDLKRLAEVGKKGVNLLLCDSTNVEREGFSISESVVGKTLDELIGKYKNERIIVASFASNIHRLQKIIDCAKKYGRKVMFTGRSMVNISDMAIKLGELTCDRDIIVDIDKIDKYQDNEILIISTGSQGETMSALTRIIAGSFPKVNLCENDVVILSSSPIPGNEKAVNNMINALYRKGCIVVNNELADVHASGHAYKEELKIIHSLVREKFFIPVHGEYRHLKNHQLLAKSLGLRDRDVIIPELGMQVEMNGDMIKVGSMVQAGDVLIDGTGLGEKDSNVIRDRILLSEEGVCAVLVTIAPSGKVEELPEIVTRGFIYQDEIGEVISSAKEFIRDNLNTIDLKSLDNNEVKAEIRRYSTNYFFKHTKRKPVILALLVRE